MNAETTYNRLTVNYDTAIALVTAGVHSAREHGVLATIVVADAAGEPVAIARTDGAAMLSLQVASDKAWTAANAGRPTHEVNDFVATDPAAVLCMPSVPRFTVVAGGFTLIRGEQVVGAIGVSGGSSADDAVVAQEALARVGAL